MVIILVDMQKSFKIMDHLYTQFTDTINRKRVYSDIKQSGYDFYFSIKYYLKIGAFF